MIRLMSSIQIVMPVLPITPGRRLIISTWVITPIPGMVLVTVMVVGGLSGSVMVIHRGITLTVIMATIRQGMPRIIATLIILPGDPITVIIRTITAVITNTRKVIAEVGTTTATREMIIMIAVTVVQKMKTGMKTLLSDVTRVANSMVIVRPGLTAMYRLPLPGIPATGVW
jgi:hypothetical protein